jgi:DNA-binding protein WhiA
VGGNVSRRVNCETSNINKAVTAGMRQVKAIRALDEAGELDVLSDGLYDIAMARLTHPEATLEELGQLVTPPVTKSGVNHRLRKLCELAEQL